MLSLGTWNQLRYTEKYKIPIGLRRDYRSSISNNEYEVFVKVDTQELFWAKKDECIINKPEFNSLGLSFMHFMDKSLNYKTNPYKVMKVWVDVNEDKKTPMYGVQQVYKDTIKCKLIGTPEQIEKVNKIKSYEEEFDINDELARIRGYKTNDFYTFKREVVKMSNNSGGIEFVEVTSIDDYDCEYEIHTDWKTYKRQRYASRRMRYLEECLIKIEDRIGHMDWKTKEIYKILADHYQVVNYDIDERHILAEDASGLASVNKVHPAEIWKAYWVHIEPWVKKEMKFIEENIL